MHRTNEIEELTPAELEIVAGSFLGGLIRRAGRSIRTAIRGPLPPPPHLLARADADEVIK
jgi:hypothetical protein